MRSPAAFLRAAAAALALAAAADAGDFSDLPEEEMSLHHRAVAHWGQGMLETAEGEFLELLSAGPGRLEALSNLGLLRLVRRRPEEAGTVLEMALAAAPKSPRALYLLGRSRLAAGRAEEAVGLFQGAAALEPRDADIRFRLAEALLAAGRGPEARGELRRVLELNPRHGPALYRLGRSFVAEGRKKEGEVLLGRYAALENGRTRPFRYDEPWEPGPSGEREDEIPGPWLEVRAAAKKRGGKTVLTVSAGKLVLRRPAGDKPVRFGLGTRPRADSVKADWPDGTHTYRVNAEAAQPVVLSEEQAHVW